MASELKYVDICGKPIAKVNNRIAIGSSTQAIEIDCGKTLSIEDDKRRLIFISPRESDDEAVNLLYRSDFGKTSVSDKLPYRTQLKRFCVDARYAKIIQDHWKDAENVPIGKLHGIKLKDELIGFCFSDGLFMPTSVNSAEFSTSINPPIAAIITTKDQVAITYML